MIMIYTVLTRERLYILFDNYNNIWWTLYRNKFRMWHYSGWGTLQDLGPIHITAKINIFKNSRKNFFKHSKNFQIGVRRYSRRFFCQNKFFSPPFPFSYRIVIFSARICGIIIEFWTLAKETHYNCPIIFYKDMRQITFLAIFRLFWVLFEIFLPLLQILAKILGFS